MLAAALADLVFLLHLSFILFVIFGGFLVMRYRWLAWLHLPMVLWSATVNITPWRCPLTPLENFFRIGAGEAGYEGGYIAHYIAPLIYPEDMSWDMGLLIGISVFVWNVLLYALLIYRLKQKHNARK